MAAIDSSNSRDDPLDVVCLVVGMGPAGGALACFLASYGLKGLMISSATSTADTPRAHITNPAAIECLRDIGLEDEVLRNGNGGDAISHTRWCYSMAGEEYARVYSWGHDPRRKGDYDRASPCRHIDCPQTQMEPILGRYATLHGFESRFSTLFVKFTTDDSGKIVSELYDKLFKTTYRVRSKYLFGADGARSRIARQLELPLDVKPTNGLAINVVVEADLSEHMENRKGNLHMIMQADRVHPQFGSICMARMVKPWHEWMFILLPTLNTLDVDPSNDEYLEHVRALIGDPSINIKILSVSKWVVNEIVAEKYSEGNVFCLGDAVHRHPPMNGLGSNTCIQDAYNLAWKIAYVEKGYALPTILDTYSVERQPVGVSIVTRANRAFRHWGYLWEILGLMSQDLEARKTALQELELPTPTGKQRRKAFHDAIAEFRHEFHGLGVEMGQHYHSSAIAGGEGVSNDDVHGSASVLGYAPRTVPGRRLPHAWLNLPCPKKPVSTHDLAGKGAFCLFTGPGGDSWKQAALHVKAELGIPLNAYSIGFRQDWEDVYLDWAGLRGVEESGCVLVRPDRFVAWRCDEVLHGERICAERLSTVVRYILGWT